MASCSSDTTVKLWNTNLDKSNQNQAHLTTLEGHSDYVSRISFNKNSNTLYSAGYDKKLFSWDLENPEFAVHSFLDKNSNETVEDGVHSTISLGLSE